MLSLDCEYSFTRIIACYSGLTKIPHRNGSGKSNILDSICFVLGITNMTTVSLSLSSARAKVELKWVGSCLQVRAQNLLDLIYKRGQAGVTRASVTIVFDNSDKSTAPVGFENMAEISVTRQVRFVSSLVPLSCMSWCSEVKCEQISVNGQSKYLVCGHRSTQQQVQSLFQSVQLNINNPNFLIMQGTPWSLSIPLLEQWDW